MKASLFFTLINLSIQLWAQDTLVTYHNSEWDLVKSKEEANHYRHSFINENKIPTFIAYYMTGELKAEGTYKTNAFKKFSGPFKSYHKNGTVSSSGMFNKNNKIGKWEYWYDNGQMLNLTHYNKKGDKHGLFINWYKDSSLDTEGNFVGDKEDGDWKFYFENGQMSALETYNKGKLEDLKYWTINGDPITETELKVFEHVEYSTGSKGINDYLINNFRYPKKAFFLRIEGKVYVKFTVETTGEVSDISFSGIKNDELQAEAKRLSKGLINWIPAKNHNRLIKSSYTLPISFRIR